MWCKQPQQRLIANCALQTADSGRQRGIRMFLLQAGMTTRFWVAVLTLVVRSAGSLFVHICLLREMLWRHQT